MNLTSSRAVRNGLMMSVGLSVFLAASLASAAELEFSQLKSLRGKSAVLVADTPGGTITVGGKPVAEGTEVTFEDRGGMIGMGAALSDIVLAGKKYSISARNVIDAESLSLSPDGQAAVFSSVNECGDYCYSVIWLFTADGGRQQIAKAAGPFPTVAWSKDGKQLAIGSRGLYLATLNGKKTTVTRHEAFAGPAFGPNGKLYVRGNDKDDAVYKWRTGKAPQKLLSYKGKRPEPQSEADVGDPDPVTFEKGRINAIFERGEKRLTRTTRLR